MINPCTRTHIPRRTPAHSFSEQKQVEDHFTKTLFFIPECHKGYWIGYKATSWPNFQSLVIAIKKQLDSGDRCCILLCYCHIHAKSCSQRHA